MGEDAGWYRDPAPPNPGAPATLRYWDGTGWTAQVKPARKQERRMWQAEAAAQQREWAAQQLLQQPTTYAGQPGTLVLETSRDHTPDGQPLAGWWLRVGATLIDGLLSWFLGVLFAWHFVRQAAEAARDYVVGVQDPSSTGSAAAGDDVLVQQFTSAYLGIIVVMVLVRFLYDVGFLKGFQATPGKMALGLEVRLRERPGVLSWGTVLSHWAAQRGYGLVAFVPLLGPVLVFVYGLLDPLWPLWDGRRQALHDKVARTNVVRTR